MCAIQTNVAFIMFWVLSISPNCTKQTATETTTTIYTTLPGAELQSMMAFMMSKYTKNATQDLLGGQTEGISHGPNLGYEPYWYNLVDKQWEEKCKRCSKLFRNYTTVCAVDGTGNMYVNISMCALMRQNCLAGTAYGNTTGKTFDFSDGIFVVQEGWARFAIKLDRELRIILSNSPKAEPPYYTIILDGWGTKFSKAYRDNNNSPSTIYENHNKPDRALGRPLDYTEFVIRWNSTSGWILMTKASYTNWTQGFYLNWTDAYPFSIKYMSISSNDGYKGQYIIKDLPKGFVVSNLGPCANTPQRGVPRVLATNPTAVPPIIEKYSTFNKGYFTRLKAAGFDPSKQAFSTREEY